MNSTDKIIIAEESFLIGEKCLFWEKESILILADIHIGKVEHFRKEGIAVPKNASKKNWTALKNSLNLFQPKKVLFLGDLFHSEKNSSFEEFNQFIKNYSKTKFILVLGNHDQYCKDEINIQCVDFLIVEPFLFTHHPKEDNIYFNIAGHIHPAVTLKGKGRQKMVLPCLWVKERSAIMPAFGNFTGNYKIKPSKGDDIILFE